MKTTEVFIELVLIGSMVLAIAGLPFAPEIVASRLTSSDWPIVGGIVASALLIGIAYLLGIVFDRLANSCIEIWENHSRLRFASKLIANPPNHSGDPFPEDAYRARVAIKCGEAAEWIHYFRVRVRLARSVFVFLPALTLSLEIALLRCPGLTDTAEKGVRVCKVSPYPGWINEWLGLLALTVFVVVLLLQTGLAALDGKEMRLGGLWQTPRTNDEEFVSYEINRRSARKNGYSFSANLVDYGLGAPSLTAFVLLGCALYVAVDVSWARLAPVWFVGFGVTLLSGWAWLRINKTDMTYVALLGEETKSDDKG